MNSYYINYSKSEEKSVINDPYYGNFKTVMSRLKHIKSSQDLEIKGN